MRNWSLVVDVKLRNLLILWQRQLFEIQKYSEKTVVSYAFDVSDFLAFLTKYLAKTIEIQDLKELSVDSLRAFLASSKQKKLSAVTRARKLSALKSFYQVLEQNLKIKNLAFAEINYPKIPKSLPKSLELAEITRLFAELKQYDDWVGCRDYVIILLFYSTGLRISEVLALTESDINSEFIMVKGKGKKQRYVPLLDNIYAEIRKYIRILPYNIKRTEKIFKGVKGGDLNPRIIQRKIENLKYKLQLDATATPHSLRHSFASHLLANGVNLREIQEMLGHESLTTTERYTKINKEKLFMNYHNLHLRS
jgi:integrase/recombinase XerC